MCTTRKKLPSSEDDPDVRNPKGLVMRLSFPELFGSTRIKQLITTLRRAGFKSVRVTRPASGTTGTWKIEMQSNIRRPSATIIVAKMIQIAETLCFDLDRETITTEIVRRKITVSFAALT